MSQSTTMRLSQNPTGLRMSLMMTGIKIKVTGQIVKINSKTTMTSHQISKRNKNLLLLVWSLKNPLNLSNNRTRMFTQLRSKETKILPKRLMMSQRLIHGERPKSLRLKLLNKANLRSKHGIKSQTLGKKPLLRPRISQKTTIGRKRFPRSLRSQSSLLKRKKRPQLSLRSLSLRKRLLSRMKPLRNQLSQKPSTSPHLVPRNHLLSQSPSNQS